MLVEERREEILKLIMQKKNVSSTEISKLFDITEETARRDLGNLRDRGLVVRTHGGAYIKDVNDSLFEDRMIENREYKERIGKAAADIIKDGEAVFLDGGSTTYFVSCNIRENSNIIASTNSHYCINELSKKSGISVISTGGTLKRESMTFVGSSVEAFVRQYNFNKVFLSAIAISSVNGLMDSNEPEARVNRSVIQSAVEVIVVADSSKFGKVAFINVCNIERINCVITDDKLDKKYIREFEAKGVKIIVT